MTQEMKTKLILLLSLIALLPTMAMADFNPTAYYTVDGEALEATDAITDAQAPLSVTFKANPSDLGETTPTYEWRFTKTNETDPYIVRYEEETTYEFKESGSTTVQLYVSYSDENEAELIATITVTISASLLEMPNAFSPNGDGVNDIYKAKENHKSIIDFHAYIFNRWGQKLYEWTDIDGGWDGTFHGKQVPVGTYYVLVKAKGADGREYNIKRDVNILRDYTEAATSN